MKRDVIDFENGEVSTLFRRLLIPTLLGTLAMSAMTAIDGIIVGHGVGAIGVAAVNIVVPIYQIMSGLALMVVLPHISPVFLQYIPLLLCRFLMPLYRIRPHENERLSFFSSCSLRHICIKPKQKHQHSSQIPVKYTQY